MSPLEQETKLLISPDDYRRILEVGTVRECTDQLNVYLHDPDRLAERGETFRVRFETGRDPVATLKLPVAWKGGMRQMVEVERPLSELGPGFHPRPRRWIPIDAHVPEGFMEHLQALGITRVRRLGWMRNRRCVVELPGRTAEESPPHGADDPSQGGTVEVDRYTLPGGEVLHEVEIEHPVEAVHRMLVARVKELAPSAEVTRMGKFSRFLEALPPPQGLV